VLEGGFAWPDNGEGVCIALSAALCRSDEPIGPHSPFKLHLIVGRADPASKAFSSKLILRSSSGNAAKPQNPTASSSSDRCVACATTASSIRSSGFPRVEEDMDAAALR